MKGAVAAGHLLTVEAGQRVLDAGGNAFDAALAAMAAACVVEPVLTTLGGGGFLLSRTPDGDHCLYDFFVQTPKKLRQANDLYPITADFGTVQQEFHIGMGSIATPGAVEGITRVHQDLANLPLKEILQPAIDYASEGVMLNALQASIFSIVAPIYVSTAGARAIYTSPSAPERLLIQGEVMYQPELADTFRLLAEEGRTPFYEGDWAQKLVKDCDEMGGNLSMDDMRGFQTIVREPLCVSHRDARIYINPPPSAGGTLIAFALELLQDTKLSDENFGSSKHLGALISAMEQTGLARTEHGVVPELLDKEKLNYYRQKVASHPLVSRGTTHISVIDEAGNAASLTLSNGEGSGYVLPGSGVMLNNMLGEEDLNPDGFNCWKPDVRVSSMMAPCIAEHQGKLIALGSGGSNRLRSAILQTFLNLVDFGMTPQQAVSSPRIHFERGLLNIEPGFESEILAEVKQHYPNPHLWDAQNLFFGGAHTVCWNGKDFEGAGDPRRGGVFGRI